MGMANPYSIFAYWIDQKILRRITLINVKFMFNVMFIMLLNSFQFNNEIGALS